MLLGSPEQSDRMLYLQVLSSGICICALSDLRSSNLNVRRSDSPGDPVEMPLLTQFKYGVGPAQSCFTDERPGDAHAAGAWTTPGVQSLDSHKVEVWEGGLGQGWSFLVAQRQSFQWPQTSEDSNVSGLDKPSVGSEGETQKEASEGVQLGEGGPQTRNVTRSRAPRHKLTGCVRSNSLLYCDKMNSPLVARPAANFSSYLLCE